MKQAIHRICLEQTATLHDALKAMTYPGEGEFFPPGIVLVVDADEKLLGIVTDGDVRRAILGGVDLQTHLKEVMTEDPLTFPSNLSYADILASAVHKIREVQEAKSRLRSGRLDQVILVDGDGKLVDVVAFFELWKQSEIKTRNVAIVGLGYVGLTLAVALADVGFNVVGVDKNKGIVDLVNDGKAHFHEVGLDTILSYHIGKNLRAALPEEVDNEASVYIISVGTPVDDTTHAPQMDHLENSATWIGKRLKKGDLVVLRSTVPIGISRSVVLPLLESESGLVGGNDFHLAFAPERTIEGRAMEELRKLPQVVGGLTRADREMAANLFSELTPNIVLVDNLEEAEMVKIVNNTFRDVSFAYANELSLICDKFNLDTVRIINAANEGYPRNRVSLPSPGVGGACLKKDPHLLKYSCEQVGYEPKMITKSKEVNDSMPLYVFNKLSTYCTNQGLDLVTAKIFIMGLAFKGTPETSDVRHSSTLDFINLIDFDKKNIFGYDAVVDVDTILSCGVTPASIEDGFKDANAVLIMNNHHSFRNINIYQLLETMKKPAIFFDTWHIFEPEEITKFEGISYASMGFITS